MCLEISFIFAVGLNRVIRLCLTTHHGVDIGRSPSQPVVRQCKGAQKAFTLQELSLNFEMEMGSSSLGNLFVIHPSPANKQF